VSATVEQWPEVRIGDLGEVFTGRTPSTERPSYFGKDFPFITPGDMHQGKYARETGRGLSLEGAGLLKRICVPAQSVCVSCIGWQMGEVIMTNRPSFTNQQINTIVPNGKVEPSFLYYSLRPRKNELLSLGATTGVRTPILNKSTFCDLKVKLPPLPVQRHIAGILSAYDELIENSQRRIKILEAMARGLYREWFVHFRFPGHEGHPRVASAVGEIPAGWEIGRLDDVLVLQRGFDLPKAKRLEGAVPIYAATGVTGFHNESKVRAPGVVTGRSGTIGDVLYVQEDFWPLNTALWVKEFPRSEPLYAYYLLNSLDLKQFNSGAAVPTLNRNDIHGLEVLIPLRSLQRQFQEVAGTMLQQSRTHELQIQALRRTRDLLLPRLLAGQITNLID
jgi:type I restriction enzyme S subunit